MKYHFPTEPTDLTRQIKSQFKVVSRKVRLNGTINVLRSLCFRAILPCTAAGKEITLAGTIMDRIEGDIRKRARKERSLNSIQNDIVRYVFEFRDTYERISQNAAVFSLFLPGVPKKLLRKILDQSLEVSRMFNEVLPEEEQIRGVIHAQEGLDFLARRARMQLGLDNKAR